ncbi:hypothetical protein PUNSTDRAFT_143487 [Punctularia strigosozonata HHB-11173 SS5]|uniref:uncharacterized protein n=1 Tax=Punctularia strigosozonata (strain HHB-11173) TaxID=741275 RepID=UPI0004417F32|nr:uncharacterized protein PUNSTDRAFT_143487 [Punctularia strigosozonata HHB-11173 SS5]EIN08759.1 hypothetical protein PUNSTDRAFT_143487 [Punctularia strigosozonata HHB-11173 SS5]
MIVAGDSKQALLANQPQDAETPFAQADVTVNRAEIDAAEVPPPYSQITGSPIPSGSSSPPRGPSDADPENRPFLPPVKPCNYLYLSRQNSSIRGQYVVDPLMSVPSVILPELPEGEVRKNLSINSKNGGINAEIWVMKNSREGSEDKGTRTTLNVESYNGSILVKVRTSPSACTPFILMATGHNGGVMIHVPRTFCGPVSAFTKNGSVSWSNTLEPHVTMFSEQSNKRQAFIGDLSASGWAELPETWVGDEIVAETWNGSIKFQFIDEPVLPSTSILTKLFGWGKD